MIRNLVSVLIAMFLCLPAYAEKENKSDKTEETTAKESVETEVDENEDEDEDEDEKPQVLNIRSAAQ